MKPRSRLGVPAAMVVVALSLIAAPARADLTKEECIDANSKGQDLLHDGKAMAARVQLQSCAVLSCPAMIRDDCTRRLSELDKVQPAIVFEARDASGNELTAVRVLMDGTTLADKLDGTPLRADPGEHDFVFTADGYPSVTQHLVLAERDQKRRERIVMGPAPASAPVAPAMTPAVAPAPSSTESPSPAGPGAGMSALRVAGLVTGGVGIAGVAVGSVFGLMTGAAWNSQKSDCASPTNCPHHAQAILDHSAVSTDSTISTVAFVAGGLLLAAGAVMFFTGTDSAESATTGLVIAPSISPRGGAASLRGTF
jgi:hypothetical protein